MGSPFRQATQRHRHQSCVLVLPRSCSQSKTLLKHRLVQVSFLGKEAYFVVC